MMTSKLDCIARRLLCENARVSGVHVEISAQRFGVPLVCVCCDGPADTEKIAAHTRRTGKRVIREDTRGIAFPYCQRCLRHALRWESAAAVASTTFMFGLIAGVGLWFASTFAVGLIAFAVALVLAIILFARRRSEAKFQCVPSCVTPQPAVSYLGWSGTVKTFAFYSPNYAAKFALENARKLVNVTPGLRQLIEQHAAQVPVERATPSPRSSPPPQQQLDVVDWIAKIEGYAGAVARRNALERALAEITEPRARQQLLIAASRIEIAAVLDKVDRLASAAAKKRHLEKALVDIRADNIPDELQVEEVRQLEERLSQIVRESGARRSAP